MPSITSDIKYDYHSKDYSNFSEYTWLDTYRNYKTFIEAYGDLNKPVGKMTGRRLLHLAVFSCDILRLLLSKGADIHVKDNKGYSVLDYALDAECRADVLDILGERLNLNIMCVDGLSPLQVAMIRKYCCDNDERFKILMKHGADINFESKQGTALDYAIAKGKDSSFLHLLLMNCLNKTLSDHNKKTLNKLSDTDLLQAFIGPRMDLRYIKDSITDDYIECLVNRFKGDINKLVMVYGHYGNLVHLAFKCPKLLKQLRAHDADLSAQDQDGRTVLHYAVMDANIEVIEMLHEYHADPKIIDNKNMYPIHSFAMLKCQRKDRVLRVLRYLQGSEPSIDLNNPYGKDLKELFINSICLEFPSILPEIVDMLSLKLNIHNIDGDTPLMVCARRVLNDSFSVRIETIKYLLEKGADIDYCTPKGTMISVMIKEYEFDEDLFDLVIKNKTSKTLELIDDQGRTPLCDAVDDTMDIEKKIIYLLKHGAKIDCGGRYGTALNYALIKKNLAFRIEFILQHITRDTLSIYTKEVKEAFIPRAFGPRPERLIQKKECALDIALRNGDLDVIILLIRHGAKASKHVIEEWQSNIGKKSTEISKALNGQSSGLSKSANLK